ncbi:hypothetical protein WEU38_11085 [Cyanobacterium aponinum AL20118]|uniref:Uncharacterized protein n=2 Tax=Cyanobacterium aponinum TaxID=379064 RepID=A0A844GR51_9CHRO|nr:hypothetical protein [Cyanobacterium aponinum]MTF37532.1 hypothetical protein [Cyanobacterium aponinum 0216]WPF87356.1 hypothetical protein SAY89_11115 [Cyanobacterium aponinum AL20115]
MKKLSSLMLAGLVCGSIIPSVSAQIAVIEDDKDIYLSGLGSYQQVEVTYEGVPKTSKKSANECGYIRLSSTTSTPLNPATDSITFNGTNYVLASVPLSGSLKCTNGVLNGNVVGTVQKDADDRVYITGLTPFGDYEVSFDSIFTTRKVKANTCGIARISHSDKYDNTAGTMTIKDVETGASLGVLPTTIPNAVGPICKKGQTFLPNGYPSANNLQ